MTNSFRIGVEVTPDPARHPTDLGPRDRVVEDLASRMDDIAQTLKVVAEQLGTRLDTIEAPDRWGIAEVELKLALELEAGTGVLIPNISARAGIEATLKFSR